jgi:hypothetical protein
VIYINIYTSNFVGKEFYDTLIDKSPNPKYNPQTMLGLDPVLGDILFEPSEVPIIRGGWYDRNNFYYSDDINEKGLKSVNIINKGMVDSSKRQKI